MAYKHYLVEFENELYINTGLYISAIAKGERAFITMLTNSDIKGVPLLDQILYPITPEQLELCRKYNPIKQSFDDSIRQFNILSIKTLREIKEGKSDAFPNATAISIREETIPKFYRYKYLTFFRVSDYKETNKYNMLPKMASIKIFGSLYIALNSVDVSVETPIIAILNN
jgi:hypothetical protein